MMLPISNALKPCSEDSKPCIWRHFRYVSVGKMRHCSLGREKFITKKGDERKHPYATGKFCSRKQETRHKKLESLQFCLQGACQLIASLKFCISSRENSWNTKKCI